MEKRPNRRDVFQMFLEGSSREQRAVALRLSMNDRTSLWVFRWAFFPLSETPCVQTEKILMFWNHWRVNWVSLMSELSQLATIFSITLERKLILDTELVSLHLVKCKFSKWGDTWAVPTVEREGSFRDKLAIDVIDVARMSMRLCTELVGIGLKSHDSQGAVKTRSCTSSSVIEVKLCNSAVMSWGLVTL